LIVRVLVWSLFDADTTPGTLRRELGWLEPPSTWLWNDAGERFGAVVFGEELSDELERARALIGRDPDVYEEFDAG
jgi:hypothetical protein